MATIESTSSGSSSISPGLIKCLGALLIGAIILACPVPPSLDPRGWHLLAIFVPTIFCIITKPLPMGAVAFLGLTLCVLTNTISVEHALEGFGYEVVWLVILAFFIAKGFLVTSFGERIAYYFVGLLGKRTLGLSYGLAITDLLLAPVIPSVSARIGGTIYPIVQSVARSFGSLPHHPSRLKVGSFLTQTAYQVSAITCAMFLTAMAANPLVAELAKAQGIIVTWRAWALGAALPGLISLVVIPLLVYRLDPPQLTYTPDAPRFAREKLASMGRMGNKEWIMAGTMILLLGLWMFGEVIHLSTVTAAMVGLSILLLTGVLSWKTLLQETDAWETFVWFSILLVMAKYLNVYGVPQWFSTAVVGSLDGLDWRWGLGLIGLVYFYSHYFFASATAHVSSMFVPFLAALLGLGAPSMLVVCVLMYASNLFGSLNHYTFSHGPLLYGTGYSDLRLFWKTGLICSLVNVLIWSSVGPLWWSFLGYW